MTTAIDHPPQCRASWIRLHFLDHGHGGQYRGDHGCTTLVSPLSPRNVSSKDLRRAPTQAKKHSSQEQLWVDIPCLDEHPQADSNNNIACHRNSSYSNSVTQQPPDWTRDQRDQLVDEAQCADRAADILALSNALCDDKADAAVQEHEEGNAEERDAEEIGCDLRARRGKRKAEHVCEKLGGAEAVIEGASRCESVRVYWREMGWIGLPFGTSFPVANTR